MIQYIDYCVAQFSIQSNLIFLQYFHTNLDFVEFIGVTDFNVTPFDGLAVIPKKVLTCTFRLPSPGSMDKVVPLTELCLRLVDTLYSFRLSLGSKNKVDRNRKVVSDRIDKVLMDRRLQEEREENEKKRIEKEMKDKEIYDKLPTALKLKKDLKEEKKKKKEENKNLMKVVKK